jgi:hypothetical protein
MSTVIAAFQHQQLKQKNLHQFYTDIFICTDILIFEDTNFNVLALKFILKLHYASLFPKFFSIRTDNCGWKFSLAF